MKMSNGVIEWVRENIKNKRNFTVVINNFLIFFCCITGSQALALHDLKRRVCLKLCVKDDMKDFIELSDSRVKVTPNIKRTKVDYVFFSLADYNITIVEDIVEISRKKCEVNEI
jgi:hypothetical protein